MKFDSVQLMRVAEETLKYLFGKGARAMTVSYDFADDRSFCAIAAKDTLLLPEDVDYLSRVFAGPVQPEVASYYGALAGRRRTEPEMELVGTMAELDDLINEPGLGVRIVLSRREQEYRASH